MNPPDDRTAIVDVLHAYAWAIDSRDFGALATDVFADSFVADYGLPEPLRTGPEIVDYMVRSHDGLDATQHLIGNCAVLGLDGDTARTRCYVLASLVKRGTPGGDRIVFGSYYEDSLARTAAGWRITERVAKLFFRDGNRAVLRR